MFIDPAHASRTVSVLLSPDNDLDGSRQLMMTLTGCIIYAQQSSLDHGIDTNDMAMDDKVTNSVVRITGKADLKALATEGELPAWVMTAIKPSEFRIEVKDLYERMEKAKKAKQTPFHTVFMLARSSWPWMESKNLSRDAAVIPMCARLEYSAVEHYRAHLLATSDAGALLRHELNTILENLSKNTSRIVKDAEGRVQNVTSPQWTYPDGIKIRIVDGKTVREGIVLTQILSDKEMLKVV